MGIVRFEIELDNPGKTYENGSVLTGKVCLDLDAPESFKDLKITVFGNGTIFFKWGKQSVYEKEVYVDEDKHPLGMDVPKMIPEGSHVFPFSFDLPDTIPNSYHDQFGTIEYKVKAVIERAWYLWNYRASMDFAVVVPLDLNAEYCNAAESVMEEVSHTVMGSSDPIYMNVSLPVRGFVPGQTMPVMVYIRNDAQVRMKSIRLTLIKVNIYHGTYARTRRDELVLAEHETPVPEWSDIETRITHLLKIPMVQPSFLMHSSLIDLEYLVRVGIKVGGFHSNFKLDVPIIIGTTALLASKVAMSQGIL